MICFKMDGESADINLCSCIWRLGLIIVRKTGEESKRELQ